MLRRAGPATRLRGDRRAGPGARLARPLRPPRRPLAAPGRPQLAGRRPARLRGLRAPGRRGRGDRARSGRERPRPPGVEVEAVHAEHVGARRPLSKALPALGYVLPGSPSIWFAGDTDLYDGMEELRGRVDVALIPVAGWGPKVGEGHMDAERAARAVEIIEPEGRDPDPLGHLHGADLPHPRPRPPAAGVRGAGPRPLARDRGRGAGARRERRALARYQSQGVSVPARLSSSR